jgi:hypothetical protein
MLVTEPLGLQRQFVDALGLSVAAPAFVLFTALAAPPFQFDRYTRDRGTTGVALDATLIAGGCLAGACGLATVLVSIGVGTTLSAALLGVVVYATAFAIFTLRASAYYRRLSK